jgi:preprotein translocase subunit SecE
MFKKIQKYFREVLAEIRKTSWPKKEDSKNMTILVIVVVALLALYLGGVDFLLQKFMGLFL